MSSESTSFLIFLLSCQTLHSAKKIKGHIKGKLLGMWLSGRALSVLQAVSANPSITKNKQTKKGRGKENKGFPSFSYFYPFLYIKSFRF
jgi:hypothetical protein